MNQMRKEFETLREAALGEEAECTVPAFSSVEEGIRAAHESPATPFMVRATAKDALISDEALREEYSMASLRKKYAETPNYFDDSKTGETVGQAIDKLHKACQEKMPCIGYIRKHIDNGTRDSGIEDVMEHKVGFAGGVTLNNEEAARFNYVLNGTHVRSPTGEPIHSSRDTSDVGLLFGAIGSGIVDDAHYTVHFLQLVGRKLWVFHPKRYDQLPVVGRAHSVCDSNYTQIKKLHSKKNKKLGVPVAMSCVLNPGDYLYAPQGTHHSTCHLDESTATIIQFNRQPEEDDDMHGDEREDYEKELAERGRQDL